MSDGAIAAYALLDALSTGEARRALSDCCGARRWVDGMLARRPFGSSGALHAAARDVWTGMGQDDVLEALSRHPAIGESVAAAPVDRAARAWSADEQSGVAGADEATRAALRQGNRAYRDRFGFIFLVCATGKSAREMLSLLEARMANDRQTEVTVAAAEQAEITALRLEKIGR